MASFSGHLHRPLSAMAVAAFAAVSSHELPDKLSHHRLPDASTSVDALVSLPSIGADGPAAAAAPSASALSGAQLLPRDLDSLRLLKAPFVSLPVMQTVYQYANFPKTSAQAVAMPVIPSSPSDVLYRWHLPDPRVCAKFPDKSQTVVVLLGWLGSRQKHLKRYADWYTSRGFNVVTFTLPMSDIVSYNLGGKAEKNVEMLSEHLADWVSEESGKKIIFHTFSNTGWLCYGVILENLQQQDPSAVDKIKACVVDSAPVAAPDPQVWALGFSAALMKKRSVTSKVLGSEDSRSDVIVVESNKEPKLGATEAVLLSALEGLFDVVLNYPKINRRLSDVMELLSSKQPNCPQLYIYSSADRVIPAKSVEAFIEGQRKAGHEDLLVSLRELAVTRASNAPHPALAHTVFHLRALRALGIVLVEELKERLRQSSANANVLDRLALLNDPEAEVVRPSQDHQMPVPNGIHKKRKQRQVQDGDGEGVQSPKRRKATEE